MIFPLESLGWERVVEAQKPVIHRFIHLRRVQPGILRAVGYTITYPLKGDYFNRKIHLNII